VPIYEYLCDDCGTAVEVLQKMSDDPLEVCAHCGGRLHKVLHPVAIHFKGSGFYTTDYGRSGARRAGKGAEGEGDKGGGESAGESAGTAAKTAAKGDGAASGASSASGAGDGGRKKEKQPAG